MRAPGVAVEVVEGESPEEIEHSGGGAAHAVMNGKQMARLAADLAKRMFILPWLTRPPVGVAELSKLVGRATASTIEPGEPGAPLRRRG